MNTNFISPATSPLDACSACTADAWRHEGDSRPIGYGSLDVPLSVWAEAGPGPITAGLVREFTGPNTAEFVAVCGVTDGWQAATTGRQVVVYGDHRITSEAQRMAGNLLAGIRFATAENLANHLTAGHGELGLIIAAHTTSRGEGFWSAAHYALAPGGFVAIMTGSRNPRTHATIARRARSAGFTYRHHIIAATPAALSKAVDSATVSTAAGVKMRHVRAHRDVFVYQRPGAAQ